MSRLNQFVSRYIAFLLAAVVLAFGASFMVAYADHNHNGVGVFIGANGNAYVHGATVTATSTTGVTATTNLGGNTILWNVLASSTTKFGKLGAGFGALANVAIGDLVSFFGKVSGAGSNLTVHAVAVKDHTYSKAVAMKSSMKGTVVRVNTSARTLVVHTMGGDKTVALTSDATIELNGDTSALGSIAIGQVVKAKGSLNTSTGVFTATSLAVHTPEDKEHKKENKRDEKKHNDGFRDSFGGFFRGFGSHGDN